jgi:hypothetical protein
MDIVIISYSILAFLLSLSSVRSVEETCSNATHLQWRISQAFDKQGAVTPAGLGLHGASDNIISRDEAQQVLKALPYQDPAHSELVSGLTLKYLAYSMKDEASYKLFLDMRQRIKRYVERALNLCPGSLFIQYTAIRQKTLEQNEMNAAIGMRNRKGDGTHADNCFILFGKNMKPQPSLLAGCNETARHPNRYTRKAGSIMFLTDDYEGGEFYIADQYTGEPMHLVRPKIGRISFFTAGPECLHAGLPVKEGGRRVVVALWYHMNATLGEEEPPVYGTPASNGLFAFTPEEIEEFTKKQQQEELEKQQRLKAEKDGGEL